VTEKIVVPRLGEYTGDEKPDELRTLTPEESRGLRWALLATVAVTLLLLWSALPQGSVPGAGWMRDPRRARCCGRRSCRASWPSSSSSAP
jgi:aminobenzoyl-glutamate transport protein